jgi:hypothetical protein
MAVSSGLRRVRNLSAERRRLIEARRREDLEFDREYGVDTAGSISLAALTVRSPNWVYGNGYAATGVFDFGVLLEPLRLPIERFTFIDLGSGKGRAVLLASAQPFKKIVGVEIAEELTAIARNNLVRYPAHRRRCHEIDLICMDAASFAFPDDPMILYMYNPFEGPVMAEVAANLAASFRAHPRRIVVLYLVPQLAAVWDRLDLFARKASPSAWAIYDSEPPSEPAARPAGRLADSARSFPTR